MPTDRELAVAELFRRGELSEDEARQELKHGKTEAAKPPGFLKTVQRGLLGANPFMPDPEMAAGIVSGLSQTVGGAIQLGLDALSPDAATGFTKMGRALNKELAKVVDEDSIRFKAGEIGGGTLLPMATGLGGVNAASRAGIVGNAAKGLVGGALIGGAQYQDSDDPEERLRGHALGAATGGVVGATLNPIAGVIGKGVTKLLNSRVIEDFSSGMKKAYEAVDPDLAGVSKRLGAHLDKISGKWDQERQVLAEAGSKVRVSEDVKGELSDAFSKASDRLKGSVAGSDRASQILSDITDRIGAGKVQLPKEYSRLPLDAKEQIIQQLRAQQSFGKTTHTELRQIWEDLDGFLKTKEGKELSEPVIAVLKDIKTAFGSGLKKLEKENPDLKRLVRKVDDFKAKNIDTFDDPAVRTLLTARTDDKRVTALADILMRSDQETAEKLGKMLGKTGKDSVNQVLVKRGLYHSLDPKTGELDPARLTKFFDELGPGASKFLSQQDRQTVQGIKNLLDERAVAMGKSGIAPKVRAFHSAEYLTAISLYHLFTGNVVGAAKAATGGAVTHTAVKTINKMLEDRVGKSLLAAASRVKPGSTRMARITQAISERFGPVTESIAAGQVRAREEE